MNQAEIHTHNGPMARAWEQRIVIPTYRAGDPGRNPMFLEKRVYQGSSGAVYPYRMIHTVSDKPTDVEYTALYLENQYLKVMFLPEIGGRIQMALDKTNDYHFVYYNRVIKPALVGLAGPWIAGGIEFNWPQHHRPTTFAPTEYEIIEDADGTATIWIGEWEPMYRTRSVVGFRLYPGRAVLEINGRVTNPTPTPQTFLWWANPAVAVNDHYQAIFPPDVTAVFDHGKRDLSRFPIATSTYYKADYSHGVDISWYKDVPVPTSYMAYHSNYDFVGGYDHQRNAGILHVADHHVSPGKKMWTWGTSDFGRRWVRNLTDADGPYIELMTGVYTDNQPDFTWLKPGEEKRFTQYFLPYKDVGLVSTASERIVMRIESEPDQSGTVKIIVYASETIRIRLTAERNGIIEAETNFDIDPTSSHTWTVSDLSDPLSSTYRAYSPDGTLLTRYPVKKTGTPSAPKAAEAAPDPVSVASSEELLFWGRHLEQYRHATFSPDPYYQEILKRDPSDSRANNALGLRALRRGDFDMAEFHFQTAVDRLVSRNPNPYDGEPLFNLGLTLWYKGNREEAFDRFFKATWNSAYRTPALFYMARIVAADDKWSQALQYLNAGVLENNQNAEVHHFRIIALRKLGMNDEAASALQMRTAISPLDHLITAERLLQTWPGTWPEVFSTKPYLFIEIVLSYGHAGAIKDALQLIERYREETFEEPEALVLYLEAYYRALIGNVSRAIRTVALAEQVAKGVSFPNQLEIIHALEVLHEMVPETPMAAYELGNFYFAHGRHNRAHTLWSNTAQGKPDFPTVHRNLALSFFNKHHDTTSALRSLEKAFQLDTEDPQILLELDVLSSRVNRKTNTRLNLLEQHRDVLFQRDDLTIVYVTLLNLTGRSVDALAILLNHQFHPWEGGEGTVPEQYKRARIELAKEAIENGQIDNAIRHLNDAKTYPRTLGEGKLPTAEADNEINFWLSCAYRYNNDEEKAVECLNEAATGDESPEISFYYNDRPADAIFYQAMAHRLLGNEGRARRLQYRLRDYGESHINQHMAIDFFAVSLPAFLVFDEDLDARNRRFCLYLLALGEWGLGNPDTAISHLMEVNREDNSHPGATYTLPLIRRMTAESETKQASIITSYLSAATTPRE